MYIYWRFETQDQSRHWMWWLYAPGMFYNISIKLKDDELTLGLTAQVTNIFNTEMKKAGHELDNNLCRHFTMSRADIFNIVRVKKLRNFTQIMHELGVSKDSIGCEICKPAIGSILSSL